MTATRPPTAAEELHGAGPRTPAARASLPDTAPRGGHLAAGENTSEVRRRPGHASPRAVREALHTPAGTEPMGRPAAPSPRSTARSAVRPARPRPAPTAS
ncbi:hypothetical protein [Streptomyces sp. NPDC001758]